MPRGYAKTIRYNPRALLADMPTGPHGPRIIAERLGVERSLIYRWMNHDSTLSFNQADQYAIRLGHHPSHYWPTWFDDALAGD